MSTFLAELKRRKVYRVAAVYIVVIPVRDPDIYLPDP